MTKPDELATPKAAARSAPTPRRKRLSGPERRATIVAAAREVFLEEGYSGARTRAIAERAEITEAVLYRHFASKEEIFEAAVLTPLGELLDELVERSRQTLQAGGSDGHLVAAVESVWLEVITRLAPLLGVALFSDQASGRQCYRQQVAPFLDALLADFQAAGLLPARPGGTDGWAVVRAAFGMNLFLALDLLQTGRELDTPLLVGQITDLLTLGLSSGRSLRLSRSAQRRAAALKPR
ncbi:MAG TPA: helix-turn-helix domain-containing protein [Acidimicrobiia bacterium]|nr:helix-turn-helix domain-containing protein [Acidimicrobiia bacterium]